MTGDQNTVEERDQKTIQGDRKEIKKRPRRKDVSRNWWCRVRKNKEDKGVRIYDEDGNRICGKRYGTKNHLREHMNNKQPGEFDEELVQESYCSDSK